MNEIKTVGEEFVQNINAKMEAALSKLERSMEFCKPLLNGEHFIRERDLAIKLKLTRRTLQDYREKGYLPYCKIGGTIIYKESDIENILMRNYRSAWTNP